MKTTRCLFVYDHVKKTIVGTKSALKKAGIPNTPEFEQFASMIRNYPHYNVVVTPRLCDYNMILYICIFLN